MAAAAVGDVEAVGSHCQSPYCRQLDFLPFRCESCRGTFCLDHRSETAHHCPKEGEWARRRAERTRLHPPSAPKPNILTHESQCSSPSCKTLINTPLVPGIECDSCNRSYCLKHRLREDHECAKLPQKGARKGDRGLGDALNKLKAWGAQKKSTATANSASASGDKELSSLHRVISGFTAKSKKPASQVLALNSLKRTAKGDAKIAADKRIYVHLEAVREDGSGSADTVKFHAGAKIPKADAFYSTEWSVGKVLDQAAKTLQVTNVNNRGGGEEERLRIFWVNGGRLLEFSEKLGANVKNGDTLVLLRGVGPVDLIEM